MSARDGFQFAGLTWKNPAKFGQNAKPHQMRPILTRPTCTYRDKSAHFALAPTFATQSFTRLKLIDEPSSHPSVFVPS
jgi:hypothetical protein